MTYQEREQSKLLKIIALRSEWNRHMKRVRRVEAAIKKLDPPKGAA